MNNYFCVILVLFILLVIVGCGGWFTSGCGCSC
ncbi:MAG: sporulation protein YjcZ [Bacilli bacterium]